MEAVGFAVVAIVLSDAVRSRSGRWSHPGLLLLATVPGLAMIINEWSFRHERDTPDALLVCVGLLPVVVVAAWHDGMRNVLLVVSSYLCSAAAVVDVGFHLGTLFGPLGDSTNDQVAFAVLCLATIAALAALLLGRSFGWKVRLAGTSVLGASLAAALVPLAQLAVLACVVVMVLAWRRGRQQRDAVRPTEGPGERASRDRPSHRS